MKTHSRFLKFYKGTIDSTLREGQQYRFANFTQNDQRKIVYMLTQIGVDRIEIGNPVEKKVAENIRHIAQIKNRPRLLSHIRNRIEDLEAAIRCGIDGVNILCTVDQQRLVHMGYSLHEYLENLRRLILLAQENNLEVRVSVEDYFRCDSRYAIQVYRLAEILKVDRIGVADTLGVAMNWEVEDHISRLRKEFTTEIEVHFHNDLGQANSNAITAIKSGANWVDTTLLGIGERSGITPLSTFFISLYQIDPDIASRYKLHFLTEAENTVASMIGRDVPFNLPTNRENGFAHKAGIHLHALIHIGPNTYEPFSPKVIGNVRHLIHGTTISGKTSKEDIEHFYAKYEEGASQ